MFRRRDGRGADVGAEPGSGLAGPRDHGERGTVGASARWAEARTVAIIDIGSNTTKMCVYLVRPGAWWRQLDELRAVVRLNSGSGDSGRLTESAMARGLAVLTRFAAYLRNVGVAEVRATATSAVRDAINGAEFLATAKRMTGLDVETLPGAEEARLGALAVANSFALQDMVVLDVGGGSAQLSLLQGRRVVRAQSWPLGAVAMTESFLGSDPPTKDEVDALRRHVRRSIGGWFGARGSLPLPLVGMGGTVRNLGNLASAMGGDRADFLHGYSVDARTLSKVVARIVGAKRVERAQIDALSADRSDIIAAGAVVVQEVLRASGAGALLVSGQGLREGILYQYLLPGREPALVDDVRRFNVDNLRGRSGFGWPPQKEPEHVERLALAIYDALPRQGAAAAERDLLGAAARLHDVGKVIDYRDQHKHGLGLIMSEPIPGYTHREQALIALLVRYQRSGKPSVNGFGRLLDDADAALLTRLAGVLRLAVALDRTGTGRVRRLLCRVDGDTLTIAVEARSSLASTTGHPESAAVEIDAAREATGLLEQVYGLAVLIEAG